MAHRTILIVGAGPAGTRAAARLVAAGMRPVVVDEGAANGGQIYRRQPAGFRRTPADLYGFEAAKAQAVHGAFAALGARIDYRPQTLVWHLWENEAHLLTGERTERLAYDALILATGATDRIMPVPGWTLPGVYSLGGAQIALKAQACAIGSNVVLMGSGPLLTLVAYQYAKAGAKVAAVLDTSPWSAGIRALPGLAARPALLAKGLYYTAALWRMGVKMWRGVTPVAIEGDAEVTAVRFADARGVAHRVLCDAVGIGHGLRSETQLADLARCDFGFDAMARQWLPVVDQDGRTSVTGVYLAGDGARLEQHVADVRPYGLELEMISGNALRARFPFLAGNILAGSFSPLDGHANPRLAAPAFGRAARREGALVVENAEVLAVEKPGVDFVVETRGAGTYRAPLVMISTGAWANTLASRFGEKVPLVAKGPQMGVTEPMAYRIDPVIGVASEVAEEGIYLRQVKRGNIVYGGGWRGPALADAQRAYVDPMNTLRQFPMLRRVVPGIGALRIIRTWSGIEGYLPDDIPVIGPSGKVAGLFYAFGFCGHGFQLGPGVGETMAELMATGETVTPLAPFAISRFHKG